jgi:hypothetical protein
LVVEVLVLLPAMLLLVAVLYSAQLLQRVVLAQTTMLVVQQDHLDFQVLRKAVAVVQVQAQVQASTAQQA